MGYKCYLCLSKDKCKTQGSTFHRFPVDENTRALWFKVCRIDPSENVTSVRICSLHFTPNDYVIPNWKEFNGRAALKVGAVPSRKRTWIDPPTRAKAPAVTIQLKPAATIYLESAATILLEPAALIQLEQGETIQLEPAVTTQLGPAVTTQLEPAVITQLESALTTQLKPAVTTQLDPAVTTQLEPALTTQLEPFATVKLEPNGSIEYSPTSPVAVEDPSECSDQEIDVPKKRKFFEARYPSELIPEHFDSPAKMKRMIALVKNVDKKKSLKIKRLRDTTRHLTNRLKRLEDMLIHQLGE